MTIQQQAGEAPNGTAFCITTAPTPALDATNLVVGKVVGGWEVVQQLAALPYSRPRESWYDKVRRQGYPVGAGPSMGGAFDGRGLKLTRG